jgi:hypothetical protein
MPLLGSLHPWMPDDDLRHSLGTAWVCALMGRLNRELPHPDYRADPDVQSEVKVLEELRPQLAPQPTETVPALLPDRQQVIVSDRGNPLRPVAIISLVTPRIKVDGRKRAAFVARCLAAIANGAGLVVIDAVPGPNPSPCAELTSALALSVSIPTMAALSFRMALREGRTELDTWVNELAVGELVPPIPLCLRCGPVVLLDLEGTYTSATEVLGL